MSLSVPAAARFIGALSGGIAFGLSCGPEVPEPVPPDAAERYAAAICSAYSRCDCMGVEYADESECRTGAAALFDAVADTKHFEFDKRCFEDVLEHFESVGCGSSGHDTYVPCIVFRGTVGQGGSCRSEAELLASWGPSISSGWLASTACEGDVPCAEHLCTNSFGPAAPGDRCTLSTRDCATGPGGTRLYCARDGVCKEAVVSGGACDHSRACADADEYCEGARAEDPTSRGVCSPRLAEGSTCDPAAAAQCNGVGAFCGLNRTCEAPWPYVCQALAWPPGGYNPLDWEPLE